MRASSTKKYYTGVILFVSVLLFQVQSGFSAEKTEKTAGPVIAGVVINSCIGSITISVTSGVAPYTYVWKDGGGNILPDNSFVITGLAPDNYTVTVTDANLDALTATYTVTNPPDLTGTVVVNDVTCRGDSDAQVVVTMANGNPGYDWELFNSGGGSVGTGAITFPNNVITISGLGVDSYTLEVTDQDGCTGTINFVVTQPAQFLGSSLISQTNATCSDSANGSLQVTGTGGWGGYSYVWFDSSNNVIGTSGTISGLLPGTYTLRITDINGCQVTPSYVITGPAAITSSSSIINATCNGDSDGAIDITPGGGNGTFSYLWSNGATTQDVTGLPAGGHSVTITDIQGCTLVQNYTVTEPGVLTINEDIRNVSCFGGNNGRVRSNVTGGTAPYTYAWSTGASSTNLNNRVAGNYSLTVTDANGCSTMESFTITEPVLALAVQSYTETLPSCFGGTDGTLQANVVGGTAAYTYSWSTGATTAAISSLSSGTYTVTVTDANGCSVVDSHTLNDPTRISVTPTVNIPSCNGGADGTITVVAADGTAPYTYNWNTGDTGPSVSSLSAGTYTVTVTDNVGCSVVENIVMGEPSPILSNATVNDISCNGLTDGSIFLGVTGGTGAYGYSWNTGATSANISGLTAGTYTVTITDANTCTKVESFTVIEPGALSATSTQVDVLCRGNTTGSIDLTPTGGTAPFSYLWSTGATTQDVSSLAAGNYSVTLKDASNCSAVFNMTITQPASSLNVTGVETHVTCNGSTNGSIDLTVTGGVAPYTYSWNTGQTIEDITALASGNYSVQVTDANGCVENAAFVVTQPSPFLVTPAVTDIDCNGANNGSVSLSVSGGTAPYTYSWADGPTIQNRSSLSPGNYTVTVTDAKGCQNVQPIVINEPAALGITYTQQNVACHGQSTGLINLTVTGGTAPFSYSWSNGSITEDLSSITSGTYSVTVTDAKGCTLGETVVITQPTAPVSLASAVNQITCNGAADGQINLTVAGGTAPYTYNWSNGSTSEDLSSLPAATYTVTITDSQGCTISGAFSITDPPVLTVSGTDTDISCFGAADGTIDLTVAGGEAPYTYIWAHGPATEDVNSLGPGTYSVQVLDSRGCSQLTSFVINEPAVLALSTTQVDIACFGDATGQIDLTVSGGTAPYFYSWSNAATGEDLTGLIANTYSVVVTDSNGCTASETLVIAQPTAALGLSEVVSQVTCNGLANGSVDLTVSGGTAPYSYAWNDGFVVQDRTALSPGTHSVVVTDINGCQEIKTYTITEPTALMTNLTSLNVSCFGLGDGSVNLTVSGGSSPYSFAWSDGITTEDRSGLTPGGYSVVITDANGCQNTETITIIEPNPLLLNYTVVDVGCFGNSTGAIDVTVVGGTAPYTYSWSTGSNSEDLLSLVAGTYSVTATDANGCVVTETMVVSQPVASLSLVETISHETCAGFANGSIDITASGGTAPYSYSWNNGSTSEDIAGLLPGTYQVTVTDNLGCSTAQSYTITGPQPLSLIGAVTDLSCRNAGDGTVDITVSGGTAPYTFAWSDGQTVEDALSLDASSYSVLVTDANGCTISAAYTLTQPLELVANYVINDVTCFGETDGAIDLAITGGTAPYTYAWSTGETTQDLTNLTGGSYSIVVSDAEGCQVSAAITVEAPSAPLAASATITDASCSGLPSGRISMAVTGGTAPYSYVWSNGSSQQNLLNVFAGDYALTVTDINGCRFDAIYTIGQPDAISPSFDVTSTSCFGDTDGSILVTTTGGQGPYNYVWSNGSTSKDQFNLTGGTYNVTVTDANNCSITQAVFVGDSRELTVAVNKQDIGCKGQTDGSISLNVTGGSGSYTYLWNNGSTTRNLSGVAAGVYNVVISDAGGCATTASVVISEPSLALTARIEKSDDIACFGNADGFANVIAQGGIAPYTYLWSNGDRTTSINQVPAGDYTVSVTDANGCVVQESFAIRQPANPITIEASGNLSLSCMGNSDGNIAVTVTGGTAPYTYLWSTGSGADRISDLRAGDYTLRVVDALGCVTEKLITVSEPDELRIANAFVNQSQCFDARNGSIELEITGGTRPYSYQWSNQATSKNLIGISSGAYDVIVTDAQGCQVRGSYELSEPGVFRLNPVLSEISCVGQNDASISLNIEGGEGQLIIRWNTGNVGETLTDLSSGQYNVTVTDENGCTLQSSFNVIEPLPVSLDAFVQDAVKCGDPRSGRINLIVTGGREPYTYQWSNGETTQSLVDILPGTYAVTVRDRYGCSTSGTYSVQQPDPLKIGLRTDILINCETRTVDNRITAEVSGGFGGYQYKWSRGGGDGPENIVSEPGRLTLLIVDDQGCELSKSIDISIPELGEADFDFTSESIVRDGEPAANDPVSFFDDSFGDITDWAWDFGDGFDSKEVDPIHTYNAPGTYTVTLTITDGSGCNSVQTREIIITEGYRIMVPDAFTPDGDGNNDFFRPRMLGLEKVQFMVFNTWGEVIFNTDDVETKGWNGLINGKQAENGNYVYKLIGLSFNGLKVEREGVFALIN